MRSSPCWQSTTSTRCLEASAVPTHALSSFARLDRRSCFHLRRSLCSQSAPPRPRIAAPRAFARSPSPILFSFPSSGRSWSSATCSSAKRRRSTTCAPALHPTRLPIRLPTLLSPIFWPRSKLKPPLSSSLSPLRLRIRVPKRRLVDAAKMAEEALRQEPLSADLTPGEQEEAMLQKARARAQLTFTHLSALSALSALPRAQRPNLLPTPPYPSRTHRVPIAYPSRTHRAGARDLHAGVLQAGGRGRGAGGR